MYDLFSNFFGPGSDEDRIFAWLWPICVVGYMIGFSQFGTPNLWGFEAKDFSGFLLISSGFGTFTAFCLLGLGAAIGWVMDQFEKLPPK